MSKTKAYRDQHGELMQLARSIGTELVADRLRNDPSKVLDLLATLSGKLKIHLAMEDRSLYPALKSHKDPAVQKMAERFITEMGSIAETFGKYTQKWLSASAIKADPAAFVAETKALFEVIGKRIERENNELYAAADRAA